MAASTQNEISQGFEHLLLPLRRGSARQANSEPQSESLEQSSGLPHPPLPSGMVLAGQKHLNEPTVLVHCMGEGQALTAHSSTSLHPLEVGMNPSAQEHFPDRQTSPTRQSESILQPGSQILSIQISPWRQFWSVRQNFMHRPSWHCSPRAQSALEEQSGMQKPL